MIRHTLITVLLVTLAACTLGGEETPTTPTTPTETVTEAAMGGITIDGGTPTALPTPDGQTGAIGGDPNVICRVRNANQVSNVAVRREPNTGSPLLYAIQPTFTASVLEIREVSGGVPWYRVQVDNPIETDLAVVEGWVRSDTMAPTTPCR
jgi:hypothetical protein